MIDQKMIDRINFLAKKAKSEGLTEEEAAEREELRKTYLAEFRKGLTAVLENTYVQTPDGEKKKLERRGGEGKEYLS